MSDEDLYKALMSMFGVGTKVANCVMLFAFARTGRFPVDVWIQRIEDKYYNGHFDCTPYPETAGIMQQFMFYYERRRPQE
jgi:N-glycosylase/DNA lyase